MTQARATAANLKPISRHVASSSVAAATSSSSKYLAPSSTTGRNARAPESGTESDAGVGAGRKVTEHTGGGGTPRAKRVSPLRSAACRGKSSGSQVGRRDDRESIGDEDEDEDDDDDEDDRSQPGRQPSEATAADRHRSKTPCENLADMGARTAKWYAHANIGQDPSRSSLSIGGADESFQEAPQVRNFGEGSEVSVSGGSASGSRSRSGRDLDESSVISREDKSYQYETVFEVQARQKAGIGKVREGSVAMSTTSAGPSRGKKGSPTKHGQSGSTSARRGGGKAGKDQGYKPGLSDPFFASGDEASSADEDAGEGVAANRERRDNAGTRIPPRGPGYLGDDLSFDPNKKGQSRRKSGGGGNASDSEADDGSGANPSDDDARGGHSKKVPGSPQKKRGFTSGGINAGQLKNGARGSGNAGKGNRDEDEKDKGKVSGNDYAGGFDFGMDPGEEDSAEAMWEKLSLPMKLLKILRTALAFPWFLATKLVSDFIVGPCHTAQAMASGALGASGAGKRLSLVAALMSILWLVYLNRSQSGGSEVVDTDSYGQRFFVHDRGYSGPYKSSEVGESGTSSEVLDRLVARLEQMERALDIVGKENKVLKASHRGLEVRVDAQQADEAETTRLAEKQFRNLQHDASDLRAQISELSGAVEKADAVASRYRSDIDSSFKTHATRVETDINKIRARMTELETQVRESLTEEKWMSVLERVLPNVVPVRMHRDTGHVEIDPKLWLEMKRVLTSKTDVESMVRKAIGAASMQSSKHEPVVQTPTWRDFLEENESDLQVWAEQVFERKSKGAMLLGKSHFLDILGKELSSLRTEVQDKADNQAAELRTAITSSSESRAEKTPLQSSVVFQSVEGNNVTGLFENIINAAISRYSKDKIGRADYALVTTGGQVIHSQTTKSITLESPSKVGWALWGKQKVTARDASLALHPESTPGMCWAFKGNKGQIGIMLSRMVVVTDVTVEHAPVELITLASLKAAPKDIQVWATLDDKEDLRMYRDYILENEHARETAQKYAADRPSTSHILLGTLTYDPYLDSAPSYIQTFPINQDLVAMGLKTQSVMFKITDNWGTAEDYTCLYRVRVHGEPVEDM